MIILVDGWLGNPLAHLFVPASLALTFRSFLRIRLTGTGPLVLPYSTNVAMESNYINFDIKEHIFGDPVIIEYGLR